MKKALLRLLRNAVAVGISAGLSYLANTPELIALSPVINAIGKLIREKTYIKKIPF